jgi:hypothetical protein
VALALAISGSSCTLITDVDRERIPVPVQPPFTEVDGGGEPPITDLDASADGATTDASPPATSDAGEVPDASAIPSDAGDAAPNGDAG